MTTPENTGQSEPASVLVTPSDVLRQACACCGAILPAPLSRLDAIPGQEHPRRAVTVALTGNHPITFLGSSTGLADALAFGRISRHYGVTAYATTPGVCHIILGVKGSLDPAIYATWMRPPGAVETVKATALAFRDAGVRITFTDTIAALHMQSDDDAEHYQAAYYAWIVALWPACSAAPRRAARLQ